MDKPRKKLSRREFLKIAGVVVGSIAFASFLTACNEPYVEAAPPASPDPEKPDSPKESAEDLSDVQLRHTEVQAGEGIIQAIERACSEEAQTECSINEFLDLGVILFREGQPFMYVHNKLALDNLAVVNDLGGTKEHDIVAFGPVGDIKRVAREYGALSTEVIQIQGEVVKEQGEVILDRITISGGPYKSPIILTSQRAPERTSWTANVNSQEYENVAKAIAAATQEP